MSSQAPIYHPIKDLKEDIIDKALILSCATGFIVYPISLFSPISDGWQAFKIIDFIVLCVILFFSLLRKRFSINVKSYVLLSSLFVIVFTDIYSLGIASANKTLLSLIPLLSIVFLSFRNIAYVMAIAYFLFALFGYFYISEAIGSSNVDNLSLSAWIINGTMLLLSSVIVFLVVSRSNKTYQLLVDDLIESNKKLRHNEADLKSQQDSLENKVDTRTKALKLINVELERQKSELQETVNRLNATTDRLVQSEKLASIGLLASGIAHEINNPLNFIRGGVIGIENILKERGHADEELHQTIDSINDGVNRASRIVKSLNQYSHSAGELTDECNLNEIIKNCLNLLRNKLNEDIIVNTDFDQMVTRVRGNNGKLHQTFINILDNSLYALRGKGNVIISIINHNKKVDISIADTGSGIDQKDLTRILDPFFTTKEVGEGSGLGLYIASSIIKEHGGEINFTSKLNEGTTCNISLPKD